MPRPLLNDKQNCHQCALLKGKEKKNSSIANSRIKWQRGKDHRLLSSPMVVAVFNKTKMNMVVLNGSNLTKKNFFKCTILQPAMSSRHPGINIREKKADTLPKTVQRLNSFLGVKENSALLSKINKNQLQPQEIQNSSKNICFFVFQAHLMAYNLLTSKCGIPALHFQITLGFLRILGSKILSQDVNKRSAKYEITCDLKAVSNFLTICHVNFVKKG
ncbi:hypothetical protein EGR_03976 [Echinococcus granulosus]|uniref:Uncharacterized protein n=1 Tax=Echinococcus granulosus TaxID=6210 RepID=W6UJA8_ECHGR|nr:hypothetical protein EGR_03976 [Echinococcus granulosus]EUB61128.1 hypothetical protein EGR_03976 [Echinococcus granulosus]